MDAFERLKAKQPPTTGQEISSAIVPAIAEIGRANAELAATIAKAVRDALGAVDARPIVVQTNEWTTLRFQVIRNKALDMTDVIVTRT